MGDGAALVTRCLREPGIPAPIKRAVELAASREIPQGRRIFDRTLGRLSGHESVLREVRARRELASLDEAESALAANTGGMPQRQIADALGRSQTDVRRLLRKARAGMSSQTRRLILEAAAGIRSVETVVGMLTSDLQRATTPDGEQPDGCVPGSLDAVRATLMEGLLAESDYNEIRGTDSS